MRHPCHSMRTPAVVQHRAHEAFARCFDWQPCHESVAVQALLDLLLRG